jgi:C4-dicarboxylate transporter DctM subunit
MSFGLFFAAFFGLLLLAVPIGVVFAFSSIFPRMVNPSFSFTAEASIRSMVSALDSYPMMAIPLFMLAGVVMAKGGISEKLFNFFGYFMGNKTAGFPCAVIMTCLFYGAISGSGSATTAAVGSMAIPFLVSMGYDMVFSTAMVAVAGGLGVIIPPSIPFILYSGTTNTSTSSLFIGGVLPGILIGVCLMVYAYYYCRTHGEDKEKLRINYEKIRARGFLPVLVNSIWALLAPLVVLGSIYGGVASPTEAAAISIYYALFVSIVVYKTLSVRDIPRMLMEGVNTYAAILFILCAAIALGRVMALLKVSAFLSEGILSIADSRLTVLLLFNVILLIAGMIMDTPPCILILAPIMMPIAVSVGVDPVHFGIIMVVNLAVGFVTPPMGLNLFVASNLTKLPITVIARKAVPFMFAFGSAMILINLFPEITLFLVNLALK